MTPLIKKEGKVVIFNIITFSSSLRRSTPTERRGEVVGIYISLLIHGIKIKK
jgi:hypothetical protein